MNIRTTSLAAVSMVIGAVVFSTVATSAHMGGDTDQLRQRLADKLGVEVAQVEGAMSQIHQENQQERHTKVESNIEAAVNNGTLTQAQAEQLRAIIAEGQQLRTSLQTKDLSREQMRDEMSEHRQVVQDWAAENNVDMSDIMQRPHSGERHGYRFGRNQ